MTPFLWWHCVSGIQPSLCRTQSPYVGARETQDEAAEVMRCLRESLRESAFASALVQLVAMNEPDVDATRSFTDGSK